MKHLLLFLLLSVTTYAQQTFVVKNQITKEPIVYTSIYAVDGTFKINSEKDGSFVIPNEFLEKTFVFDAVGYEIKQQQLTDVILLEPKSEILDEVVIVPRLGTKEVKVGKINTRKEINMLFSELNKGAFLYATKMNFYDDECRFIKEINIRTNSKIKNAKFALKIYSSNENGEPDKLLHDTPIIAFAKKGKHTTTVNIEELKLNVFSESFFIVLDQLYLEQNSYYGDWKGKKRKYYEPKVLLNTSNKSNVWIYYPNEKWKSVNFDAPAEYFNEKYFNFQTEVILTN